MEQGEGVEEGEEGAVDVDGLKTPREEALSLWAQNQRALARALGFSIGDWVRELETAGDRAAGVRAAIVGAAMARGHGLRLLDRLDLEALVHLGRSVIDPDPPRVTSPVLAEAIRRTHELRAGAGARRLRSRGDPPMRETVPTPTRDVRPLGGSADEGTPDAPGKPEGAEGQGVP